MLPAEIDQALSVIELQCQAVTAAMIGGEPLALETASNGLKQAAVDFADFWEQLDDPRLGSPELRARVHKLASQLKTQQENLIRRSVVVERALHVMVPATRKSTYAQPAVGRAGRYKAMAA